MGFALEGKSTNSHVLFFKIESNSILMASFQSNASGEEIASKQDDGSFSIK